jgi:hypothetical protein
MGSDLFAIIVRGNVIITCVLWRKLKTNLCEVLINPKNHSKREKSPVQSSINIRQKGYY